MSVSLVVLLVIAILVGLLLTRMPVWIALAISGSVGLLVLRDTTFVTRTLASTSFEQTSTFSLTIIPMFILLGIFAVRARIAEQVFTVARRAIRKLPGGLGIATVAACAGFAAVSGSSIGTAATMSKLSIGEMRKAGYPVSLAGALVAVAGTLGAMIPPSLFLVLYAILTGESIGRMLAAGIVPGVLSALSYAMYILIKTRKMTLVTADSASSDLSGRLNSEISESRSRQKSSSLPWRGVFRLAIIFAIIMGGIYSGIFTATESAAIGATFALFMVVLEYRRDGLREIGAQLGEALKETAKTTSMVFAIIVGSGILSLFFVVARVPQSVANSLTSLELPDWLILALLLALLIPLGMALESISILVITVPLIYPVATEMGFDGIWLGILIVKLIEIGMVTPPVGINCFVVAGAAKIRTSDVFRGVWPFVVLEILMIVFFFAFPDVVLWLPSLVD
ncbi:TRAP transporter large permease [Nesterenkonia sp. E16_7]|uniref:TRAP transporter large permease n=1 Tax=unclassified Nesterenkonia TaxID=2629769 RepID=UPI001A92CE39|nr:MULTISPECIES: TRAP transporter large permease [unclassified Nesterenkonia]MBO0594959.1 TRAP transporter large permease [Nesterenkonia sp. E16_10]MBO0598614.1 TRAP transporter large permease [Nesterenkonia sp. E16_7]